MAIKALIKGKVKKIVPRSYPNKQTGEQIPVRDVYIEQENDIYPVKVEVCDNSIVIPDVGKEVSLNVSFYASHYNKDEKKSYPANLRIYIPKSK